MGLIVTCGCADTDSFARDAFGIIFPGASIPPVVTQKEQIVGFAKWRPQIDALFKSDAKFAYYLSDDELWDLRKGVRVG